jgi:hypothetical protein
LRPGLIPTDRRHALQREWTDGPAVAALSGRGLLWIGTGGQPLYNFGSWFRIGAISLVALHAGYSGSKVPKMDVATDDYLLGMRLAEISAPSDIVVVSGTDSGNPLAIYYSRRRGWIFPPPPQQPDYMYYMEDGIPSIEVFEDLRRRGARWFGLIKKARDYSRPQKEFVQHHTELLLHIANTSQLIVDASSYLIYFLPHRDEFQKFGEYPLSRPKPAVVDEPAGRQGDE